MKYIEFLGTSGTKTVSQGTTCLRVSKTCVIDAGNLIEGTAQGLFLIEHIFLTHAHLDHIVDIAFMADLFVTQKRTPLKVYGLQETLNNLRDFIFNHQIWPNFEEINLLKNDAKTIEFVEIFPGQHYSIDNIMLTPFKTNHTDGSCGYLIEQGDNGVLFTSDTYQCDEIWDIMENNHHIHSLVVDVSFPSSFDKLAYDSKHMTPKLLADGLAKCKRKDFRVFPMHLKSLFETTIKAELNEFGVFKSGGHILESYEYLAYNPLDVIESCKRNAYSSMISKITSITAVLSAHKNIDALSENILIHARQLTHADGGSLYLYNENKSQLEFKIVQNDSINLQMGGNHGEIGWEPILLYDSDMNKNNRMVASVCAHEKIVINIPNVYESKEYDFRGTFEFDSRIGYSSKSMLVLPLKDNDENLLGILQLINKTNEYGETVPFDYLDEEMSLSLASQAAIVFSKQKLIDDLELTLESFINKINDDVKDTLAEDFSKRIAF